MMTESGWALVVEIRVGVGGRGHSIVERVAFARNGLGAIAGDVRDEPRLSEARLRFMLGAAVI